MTSALLLLAPTVAAVGAASYWAALPSLSASLPSTGMASHNTRPYYDGSVLQNSPQPHKSLTDII